jgi:hypothetical protein
MVDPSVEEMRRVDGIGRVGAGGGGVRRVAAIAAVGVAEEGVELSRV